MRYYNFLNENIDEESYKMIASDCMYYLNLIQYGNHYLYRGIRNRNEYGVRSFMKKSVHKNRKPLDTSKFFHDILNNIFKDIFGVKLRSESLFGTGDYNISNRYGKVYLIFPIGKFDFYWSFKIKDLFIEANDLFEKYDRYVDKEGYFIKALTDLVRNNYRKNGDMINAIQSKSEIMIDCKEYYAIKIDKKTKDEIEIYEKINHYRKLNIGRI